MSMLALAEAIVEQKKSGVDWTAIIVAVVSVVGGAGVGGGGIIAWRHAPINRRKTVAETAQVFTEAAVSLVTPLTAQVGSLQGRVEKLEAYRSTQDRLLVAHAAWDTLAIERLKAAGIDLPPVPPLSPPSEEGDTVGIVDAAGRHLGVASI